MNKDISRVKGHVIYSNSTWALTSVSQRHFWGAGYPWKDIGNGQVKDILSTIISDWDTPGNKVVTKPAAEQLKSMLVALLIMAGVNLAMLGVMLYMLLGL